MAAICIAASAGAFPVKPPEGQDLDDMIRLKLLVIPAVNRQFALIKLMDMNQAAAAIVRAENPQQAFDAATKIRNEVLSLMFPWVAGEIMKSNYDRWVERFGDPNDPELERKIRKQIRFLKRLRDSIIGQR